MTMSDKEDFESFQEELVKQQGGHGHDGYVIDLAISEDLSLEDFKVCEDVVRPEMLAASSLATWLSWNNGLYYERRVLDMGCGTGVQGLVALHRGADHAVFSDVMENAVTNTKVNVSRYGFEDEASVVQGDLFSSVEGRFGCIIFNHPFFPAEPKSDVEQALTDSGDVIRRFFEDVNSYAADDACLIMPFFESAGSKNHPRIVAESYGYEASLQYVKEVEEGLQQGRFAVYLIDL